MIFCINRASPKFFFLSYESQNYSCSWSYYICTIAITCVCMYRFVLYLVLLAVVCVFYNVSSSYLLWVAGFCAWRPSSQIPFIPLTLVCFLLIHIEGANILNTVFCFQAFLCSHHLLKQLLMCCLTWTLKHLFSHTKRLVWGHVIKMSRVLLRQEVCDISIKPVVILCC